MFKLLTWLLVPVLIFLQYECWFASGGVFTLWGLHRQISHEVQINQQLLERNHVLALEIQDLKNNSEAIEDHARNDLGMIKPGEVLYQLP